MMPKYCIIIRIFFFFSLQLLSLFGKELNLMIASKYIYGFRAADSPKTITAFHLIQIYICS